MHRFERGLVVGKFSPLHFGHEYLIGRAFAECAEVVLLSYSKPEFPGCDAANRETWLNSRFPRATLLVVDDARLADRFGPECPWSTVPPNDAPAEVHRQFCAFLCDQFLGLRVDAVYSSEDYGEGFAADLTNHYRNRGFADALVQSVTVDRARTSFPISATQLRADPAVLRTWVAPEVYASFVPRICFLGGESSGKSTLSIALAEHFKTESVAEFGRELWQEKKGRLEFGDLLTIARTQISRETEAASRATHFLFCDTTPLTTLFYSLDLFSQAAAELERLAARRYDLTVLCAPDFPFAQDGTRRDESFRQRQHAWYLAQFAARRIPFVLAEGPLERRLEQIAERVQALIA